MSAEFWNDRNILHVPRVTKKKKKGKKSAQLKLRWEHSGNRSGMKHR